MLCFVSFLQGKRDPLAAPLGATVQHFTSLPLAGNVFLNESTGRYRHSINNVPPRAFSAGLSIFWDCSSSDKPCPQDGVGAEVWATPQALKTGIIYYTYRIREQPIQGLRHLELCHPVWVTAHRHHQVKDTCCRSTMHGGLGQGTSRGTTEVGFLTSTTWMALSDLTLVSQKREWELQDIWTTDVKHNPAASTAFELLWTEQRACIVSDYRRWRVPGTQAIHLQMGKETYGIMVIRQTRGGRSTPEN